MCRHRSPRRSPLATPAPPRRGRRRCGIAARCAAAAAAPPGRAVLSELRNVAVLLADRLNVVLCGLRQDLAGRGAGLGRRDLALVLLVSDLDAARRRRLTRQAVEERLADAARRVGVDEGAVRVGEGAVRVHGDLLRHLLRLRVRAHLLEHLSGRLALPVRAEEGAGADASLGGLVGALLVEGGRDAEDGAAVGDDVVRRAGGLVREAVGEVEDGARVAAVHEDHQRGALAEDEDLLELVVGEKADGLVVDVDHGLVHAVLLLAVANLLDLVVRHLRPVPRVRDPPLPPLLLAQPRAQLLHLADDVGLGRLFVVVVAVGEEGDVVALLGQHVHHRSLVSHTARQRQLGAGVRAADAQRLALGLAGARLEVVEVGGRAGGALVGHGC
mmetsp:Transcript_45898/g.141569  ORF Transcript_45898/g.141569 Transcript_45898/m.141569 type:complete len:386 (+) Transcript_45898:753-1910(+)